MEENIMMYPTRNNWLDSAFDEFFDNNSMLRTNTTAPAVNVKVNAMEYTMEIAAPGIKKEYCRISLNKYNNLVVNIENKMEHKQEERNEHYLRREFSYGNYEQAYILPEDVDREKISAKVEDGILTIVLPKFNKEDIKVERQIKIG